MRFLECEAFPNSSFAAVRSRFLLSRAINAIKAALKVDADQIFKWLALGLFNHTYFQTNGPPLDPFAAMEGLQSFLYQHTSEGSFLGLSGS
jgi:hypothetical protein